MTRIPPESPDPSDDYDLSDADFLQRWEELNRQLGELGGGGRAKDDVRVQELTGASPSAAPVGGGHGPRDYEVEEDDGAFVPPEPELDLTGISALARLGWFLLALGIVGAIITYVTGSPSWVGILCALATAAGVVSLVMSLPRTRDDDDPGAVV